MFSELASGASYVLSKAPDSVKNKTFDRLTNIWALNPDVTNLKLLRTIPDPYMIKSPVELVKEIKTHWLIDRTLNVKDVNINVFTRFNESLTPVSPLEAVSRNIN